MVAHILKYHVPMDEAPYSCSFVQRSAATRAGAS